MICPTIQAVKMFTYPDDSFATSMREEKAIQMRNYIRQMEDWFTTYRMSAEGSMSSLTVVTRIIRKYKQISTLTLMGQSIFVTTYKNILGVTIGRSWTFHQHTLEPSLACM